MIAGVFHEGSGLGDQLFRYITVRTLAESKGREWAMLNSTDFKGDFFLNQNWPLQKLNYPNSEWNEKDVRDSQGNDIRSFDPEINFVEDNTVIDGSFEDSKYWGHNLNNISKWLAVEPLTVSDDTCLIGFRGGEYATQPDLFLGPSYHTKAFDEINKKKNFKEYHVHTDDPGLAEKSFPDYVKIVDNQPISHSKHTNMDFNWRSMRYAKYAMIPNSAFYILPRLLKHYEDPTAITIAPRYWARRNTKVWARPACYYKEFTYI